MTQSRHLTLEVDNLSIEFSLDDQQVVSLGFNCAGWGDQKKELLEKGVNVITTTTSDRMITADESIYKKNHEGVSLQKIAKNRKMDAVHASAALKKVREILENIKEPATRDSLVELVVGDYLKPLFEPFSQDLQIDDDFIQEIKAEINDSNDPNKKMLEIFIAYNNHVQPDPDLEDNHRNHIDMQGYNLISAMRNQRYEYKFKRCFKGQDTELINPTNKTQTSELLDLMSCVNLNGRDFVTQTILTQSKQLVIDTLQYNLLALKHNKPLIPIYLVVSSEASPPFIPSWMRVFEKWGDTSTNAEIRTCYKLMEEIPDSLIREIMRKTVFFHQKLPNGQFRVLPFPWSENNTKWKERARTDNKPEHSVRSEVQIQPWVKELMMLSTETLKAVQMSRLKKV